VKLPLHPKRLLLFTLPALGLLAVVFLLIGVLFWRMVPREVTDLSQYTPILHDRWAPVGLPDHPVTAHFPDPIPSEAAQIRMSFQSGFLQGGSHFQVGFHLPSDQIEMLYQQFSKKAVRSFKGGQPTDSPPPLFYLGDSPVRDFPVAYEVLVLQHEGSNHGTSGGIAIDRAAADIIYWAEAW
jgi:hypothetical protein